MIISPSGASDFLSGQKVTKEPSKGRGISISLSPLKSSLLKTTNQGGLRPPYWMYPPGGTHPAPFFVLVHRFGIPFS